MHKYSNSNQYRRPLFLSVALHVLLFSMLFFHFVFSKSKQPLVQPDTNIIRAIAVNPNDISSPVHQIKMHKQEQQKPPKNLDQLQANELKTPQPQKQPSPQPQPKAHPIQQPQIQDQQIAQQKAAQQKIAQKKAHEEKVAAQQKKIEQEKLAIQEAALQKAVREKSAAQKAEHEKIAAQKAMQEKLADQKAALQKTEQEKAQEQKEKDAKLKQELAAKHKAAEKKLQQLAAQELKSMQEQELKQQAKQEQQQLAKEAAKQDQSEIDKYTALIRQAIGQNWLVPSGVNENLSCDLLIDLGPGGVVLSVQITRSSGDTGLDNSARTAVFKASPLPVPKNPELFSQFRSFKLTATPQDLAPG